MRLHTSRRTGEEGVLLAALLALPRRCHGHRRSQAALLEMPCLCAAHPSTGAAPRRRPWMSLLGVRLRHGGGRTQKEVRAAGKLAHPPCRLLSRPAD